jgi:Immunoglobulin-like domain of bacterial spore germination
MGRHDRPRRLAGVLCTAANDIWDTWIIAALMLWVISLPLGPRTSATYDKAVKKARELQATGQIGSNRTSTPSRVTREPHESRGREGSSVSVWEPRRRMTGWRTVANTLAATLATVTFVATACGTGGDDVCANSGELSGFGFTFVDGPRSGERVSSGFKVSGCSSTFESNLNWRLRGRDGMTLASGVAQGGGLEPSSFEFTVDYQIDARQIGELEVYEPRVTTEGFPPSKDIVPLVLGP